jgi:hypothetical protein
MNAQINHVLNKTVNELPPKDRERVLAYARELNSLSRHGKNLVRFAGSISPNDLAAISDAVNAGCEKVDGNEW